MLKLYIAVLDSVPENMVPILTAHATLDAHLAFSEEYEDRDLAVCSYFPKYLEWLNSKLREIVVLRVDGEDLEELYSFSGVYGVHESTVLDGALSAVVLCPRNEYPNVIRFARLWVTKNS